MHQKRLSLASAIFDCDREFMLGNVFRTNGSYLVSGHIPCEITLLGGIYSPKLNM